MERTPPNQKGIFASASESDLTNLPSTPHNNAKIPDNMRGKRRRLVGDEAFSDVQYFREDVARILELMQAQNQRLDSLENHIKEVKSQTINIQTTNNDIEKAMNSMSDQLASLDIKINGLEHERKNAALKLSTLEEKIDSLERNTTKLCLEIRNVPKNQAESKDNLYTMIEGMSNALNIQSEKHDIRDVWRLPSKKDSKNSSLVVEFSNSLIKSKILKSVKEFNKNNRNDQLNSTHLGLRGIKTSIYVSDHLTAKMKRLHYLTREFAKINKYAHCWISNGQILLRKEDGAPYILVKTETQLQELYKKQSE